MGGRISFLEPVIIKGKLIHLEDASAIRRAGVLSAQGEMWLGSMARELAVPMRELLFKWVTAEGVARWIREREGTWEIRDFHITGCEELPEDAWDEDIKNLHNLLIAGNEWKEMTDPVGFIRESREEDEDAESGSDRVPFH